MADASILLSAGGNIVRLAYNATPTCTPGATTNASESATGSGQTSIAHWDVVPDQAYSSTLRIGVVAFHINGINRVSFQANGGSIVQTTAMTLNPVTGVNEYCVDLATAGSDGAVSVQAIVYPNSGVSRVLTLNLYSNVGGTYNSAGTLYVKPSTGSDSNAGTALAPFATLTKALDSLTNGKNIELMEEATYTIQAANIGPSPRYSTGPWNYANWSTIYGAAGLNRDNVILAGDGRWYVNHIKLQNVSVDRATLANIFVEDNHKGWSHSVRFFDSTGNTHITDSGPYKIANSGGTLGTCYVTSSIADGTQKGFSGVNLLRDTVAVGCNGDTFSHAHCVINCADWNTEEGAGGEHADHFQYFPSPDQIIVYGFSGSGNGVQGFFIGGDSGDSASNMAFVNITLTDDDANASLYKSQLSCPTTHAFFKNVTSDKGIYFRDDNPPNLAYTGTDIVFEGCTFAGGIPTLTQDGNSTGATIR